MSSNPTPQQKPYYVPKHPISHEIEIKRSRFIAQVAQVSNKEEAEQFIAQIKSQYPDARHHCWAYIACAPHLVTAIRCNDDGEPSGTAGKPILNVLQHSGLGEIICVVVRYFGGIKLGAGGLTRAYSSATAEALLALETELKQVYVQVKLGFDYALEADIRHSLQQLSFELIESDYKEQVSFIIKCPEQDWPSLKKSLQGIENRKKQVISKECD